MSREQELHTMMHNLKRGQIGPMEEVRAYCKRQGRDPASFWKHIPPPLLENLDKAQIAIIKGEVVEEALMKDAESLFNPAYQLRVAEAILSPRFKLAAHEHQFFPLKIVDNARKIVSPVYEGDHEKVLARSLSIVMREKGGVVLATSIAKEVVELWINHQKTIPMPVPMARHDEDRWCFHKSDIKPDPTVKMDRWQRILDRMSDPAAFAAWVYGVYSGDYHGRQVLWLHGPHGEDGKSAITDLIARHLFGPAHHAISNASLGSSEKRFLTSFFEHARLVIYPDASNRRCLMSEQFKTVASAGADPVLIERKGRQAYTSRLQARMWVCSNFAPEVTKDNFVLSRLMYIHIDKMRDEKPDPKVIEHLRDELPGFLHYAQQAYAKKCRDHYEILTNDQHQTVVDEMADSFFEEYEVIFQKYWEVGADDEYVEGSKVRDITQKEGLRHNHDYKGFTGWLTERKGVAKRKISQDGGKIRYYGMRKRRPPALDTSSLSKEW